MDRELLTIQGRIDRAMKSTDDAYVRVARKLGLSESAFDILYALAIDGEGCTQAHLCEISYSNKQTVNSSIHKLEREGIVRLEPGIGRSTLVFLTDAGRRLVEEKIKPVVDAELAALEAVPPVQRTALLDALERYTEALTGNLDAIEPGPTSTGATTSTEENGARTAHGNKER